MEAVIDHVPAANAKEPSEESLFKDDLYEILFRISSGQIDILRTATDKFVKAASASA